MQVCRPRLASLCRPVEEPGEFPDVLGEFGGVEDLEVNADRRNIDRDLAVPAAACVHQASLLVDRLKRRDGGATRSATRANGAWRSMRAW